MHLTVKTQTDEIEQLIAEHPEGLSRPEIVELLRFSLPKRTLQRRFSKLIDDGRISRQRDKTIYRYYPPTKTDAAVTQAKKLGWKEFFSEESRKVLNFLETSAQYRPNVYYNREFIDSYEPNVTSYVAKELRTRLLRCGVRFDDELAEGTYAKQISERLLIDLSYNSSRLEGNSYSKLDTEKLILEGIGADGKGNRDTIMIINHKEAILFLVENAQSIDINEHTIRDIHGFLSVDLLLNPSACGNLRTTPVGITNSAYNPIDVPDVLKEMFDIALSKARSIRDPFEQSFFLLVHLPYLQAFEDVNRRTSRIACNIPFVKRNLCPLSFTEVPSDAYYVALLAVYEKNEIQPMLEVFENAYVQSCSQYEAVKESLGTIDSYRIVYRKERRDLIGTIVIEKIHLDSDVIIRRIEEFCEEREIPNPDKFKTITLESLRNVREGARMGLRVTEAQLQEWIKLHST